MESPGLAQRYDDLQLPASNCALLVYQGLTGNEHERYDYYKITVADSSSSHSYSFARAEVAQAAQAAGLLTTIMANMQQEDYAAAARTLHPIALQGLSPDSVTALLAKVGRGLAPLRDYDLHGYKIVSEQVSGQPLELVQLYLSVPATPESRRLLVVINPQAEASTPFLYGFNLLD
ncbi:hypothetical protein [Hymenobacter saemangeumensis]|uniref:hypothetical protein n=1 Tax=Hymenobacter saemangeumensis TaxID=1084522 RepID=UPI0031F19B60